MANKTINTAFSILLFSTYLAAQKNNSSISYIKIVEALQIKERKQISATQRYTNGNCII